MPEAPKVPNPFTDPQVLERFLELLEQIEGNPRQPVEARPKPKRKRPDEKTVRDRIDRVVELWSLRDKRMDEDYRLYTLERNETGEGELVVKNTPWVVVHKVADIVGSQMPAIQVVPTTNRLRDQAQLIEDFLRYCWDVWDEAHMNNQLQNTLRHTMSLLLGLRGWLSLRISYQPNEDDPSELPLRLESVDPRTVYPMLGMKWVARRYHQTVAEILDEFEEARKLFDENQDLTEMKLVESYYDDWWHCIFVDGKMLKAPTAHEYGFVPWIIRTGIGSPVRATAEDTTSWVQLTGVSIFHSFKDQYVQLNRVLSQIATDVARSSNPPIIVYTDPAAPDEPKTLALSPGAVNYLWISERTEPINLSTRPSDVAPLLETINEDIAKGGLPGILWGEGLQSGYASSILTDSAGNALAPIIAAMTSAMKQVNTYALRLIRDLHEGEVGFFVKDRRTGEWYGGVTITPALIEEVGTTTIVKYRDISPKDRAMWAQLAIQLTKEKLISMETAREEYLMLDNPERENERVLTDLIYMNEAVTKELAVPLALYRFDPQMYQLWLLSEMRKRREAEMGKQEQPGGPAPPPPGAVPPGEPPPPPMSGPVTGLPLVPPPGPPPGPPPAPGPGLPPTVVPPIMQPGANLLRQSLGSALGGAGFVRPPGLPGGPQPPPLPIGLI
jgi:hypothetical protein